MNNDLSLPDWFPTDSGYRDPHQAPMSVMMLSDHDIIGILGDDPYSEWGIQDEDGDERDKCGIMGQTHQIR